MAKADWDGEASAAIAADDDHPREPSTAPRHTRRLSDKILVAFHHACDVADYEVAENLLRILEIMVTKRPMPDGSNRRRNMDSLIAAHERLWQLRHPDEVN